MLVIIAQVVICKLNLKVIRTLLLGDLALLVATVQLEAPDPHHALLVPMLIRLRQLIVHSAPQGSIVSKEAARMQARHVLQAIIVLLEPRLLFNILAHLGRSIQA